MTRNSNKPKLLLHICCAPDSTTAFERLQDSYEVHGFFYNPNIHPKEEYELRLKETKKVCSLMNLPLIDSIYDPDLWQNKIRGFENEPEGQKRCTICFKQRLDVTAKIAKDNNFNYFSTTLTISPHKNSNIIIEIGTSLAEKHHINFLKEDFKKKDGFLRSINLSKEYNLYRQKYCGCIYSYKLNKFF